jgi:hypothetical protein
MNIVIHFVGAVVGFQRAPDQLVTVFVAFIIADLLVIASGYICRKW